jgi:hypothetical protein
MTFAISSGSGSYSLRSRAELVVMSPQWAFVRTNSAGTQTVNATGATTPPMKKNGIAARETSEVLSRVTRCTPSLTKLPVTWA